MRDPARFSFAHGGKDGHPYPVNREVYDQSIDWLREAVSKPLIQNALVVFREEGYLEQLPESKLTLSQSFANVEAASTIEGRLTGFCEFVS